MGKLNLFCTVPLSVMLCAVSSLSQPVLVPTAEKIAPNGSVNPYRVEYQAIKGSIVAQPKGTLFKSGHAIATGLVLAVCLCYSSLRILAPPILIAKAPHPNAPSPYATLGP